MIHYHGMPMSAKTNTARVMMGRHALISHAAPGYVDVCSIVCQSFILDNGAFSHWRGGSPKREWGDYYSWVDKWKHHPGFDWAIIPDVIDGGEDANDALLATWPFSRSIGVPVWHMHESLNRVVMLATQWPRVAIGSSGVYRSVGSKEWWGKMNEVLDTITDTEGQPICKIHGLRMLDWRIFSRLPLSSADSCNAGVNCGVASRQYSVSPDVGAEIIVRRIEAHNSAPSANMREADMNTVLGDEEAA